MFTSQIQLMQDVQLACFAIIFGCMVLQDRANRSLRWIWLGFVTGSIGGIAHLMSHSLPRWLAVTIILECYQLAYGCVNLAMAYFVGSRSWTRWITVFMAIAALPFYLHWGVGSNWRTGALIDGCLAVQTAVTAFVVFSSRDRATAAPRIAIGSFSLLYAGLHFARVAMTLQHGRYPVGPIEYISGAVYVIAASVVPLVFIWMVNSRMHAYLTQQSLADPLTDLLNRRGLQDAVQRELARYLRGGPGFGVAIADIDNFKNLNDTFGHAFGDCVLRETAAAFRRTTRESDVTGRSGGEEFVLLLPVTSPDATVHTVERLRQAVEDMDLWNGGERVRITISFGVTHTAGRTGLQWVDLQAEADAALYQAKRSGRNRTVRYEIQPGAIAGLSASDDGTVLPVA